MSKLSFWRATCLVCVCGVVAAMGSPAQDKQPSTDSVTFTSLLSFDETDGSAPQAALVQATDGSFYGTTANGGANDNAGTVFKINPEGALTTLYSFCAQTNCTDGVVPIGGLVQGTDGNFYGTTFTGGASGDGTVFKISSKGTYTMLYSFCALTNCTDGSSPSAGLIQAIDGSFYGTTVRGGVSDEGTVFKISSEGTLTTLYSFCAQTSCTDGSSPYAGLVQATDGNFYGTTLSGGTSAGCNVGCGTVFKINAAGTLITLHSFDGTDGAFPNAALVLATNGNFYGTTSNGGANGAGNVFKITPGGTLSSLHTFKAGEGFAPYSGLVQATDGNLYGTTVRGGANGDYGAVFKITPAGALTTLHSFCAQTGCTDGAAPFGGLFQATNGNLYGTTSQGGSSSNCTDGCGTVFSLSVGLGPFVETVPTSGEVGAAVKILGNNLTGSTSVTFNGTAAVFTVKSSTEITATVPSGATSGFVKVTTSSGKILTSNVKFRVS